jgi:hypothetical protein
MRKYTINLPRGLEVDISNLPEDFKEQIEQAFREYTSGTAKAYMYVDKLGFIDRCVEYLNGNEDSDDVVNTLVEEAMISEWRNNGEIIKEDDIYCIDFMEDCYRKGNEDAISFPTLPLLSTDGIANCHSAGHGNNPKIAIPVLTPDRAEKRQNGRRFKDNGEPMFTLTRADIHGVAIEPTGFNCMPDGTCRTLKNQYQKNSGVNFACQTDRGATAVAVKFKNITASTIRKVAPRNKVSILRGQSQENNLDICVKVAEATKQGYSECRVGVDAVNLSVPGSKTIRGRVGKEIANTLDTSCNQGIFVQVSEELVVYAVWYEKYQCYIAIRKLTPKECFRLQGWSDDYFEKAQFVNSDSQLYKQAGNGVTVTVIETIARKMKVESVKLHR